jgi:hypothetical protein
MAAVEQRLGELRQTRCGELADITGKNHATISRDRGELGQWRANELILIARTDPALRGAIIEAISPQQDQADPGDAFLHVVSELGQMAGLSRTISQAIADRSVDAEEARVILQDAYVMAEFMQNTLIPSLERLRRPRDQR